MIELRRVLRQKVGAIMLGWAVKPFAMLPAGQLPSSMSLSCLQFAWGNPGYAADWRYLRRIAELVLRTRGPILECGSGLTTLLLGLLARQNGRDVVTLEHHADWHIQITQTLRRLGLDRVKVYHCPLRRHGTFDWYDIGGLPATEPFSMVVCDGPPGSTRGGRVGLVPVMGERLARDGVILLDDAHRRQERRVMAVWRRYREMISNSPASASRYAGKTCLIAAR